MYKYGCVMMVCIILGVAAIQREGEGGRDYPGGGGCKL